MTVGLGKNVLQRRSHIGSDKTQRRVRGLVEVLNKVERRLESELSLCVAPLGAPARL